MKKLVLTLCLFMSALVGLNVKAKANPLTASQSPTGSTANAATLAARHQRQAALLSRHLVLPDRFLDKFLGDVGFGVPPNMAASWTYYPDYRKLTVATAMAHAADPTRGADRMLAMLAYALAQRGDPIRNEPTLRALQASSSFRPPSPMPFGHLPGMNLPSRSLPPEQLKVLRTLTRYLQIGILGSPQSVIVRYAGLTLDQAFDVIEQSESANEAIQNALAAVSSEKRDAILKKMVSDVAEIDPAVRYEPALASLLPSVLLGNAPSDEGPGPGYIPSGSPGGGSGGSPGVSNQEVQSSFEELLRKSYPDPKSRQFDSMRKNVEGFGGIIFGEIVKKTVNLGSIEVISFEPQRLLVTFRDKSQAQMPNVSLEEALAAYNLVFDPTGSKWVSGEGIGLTGLSYDCRPGYQKQHFGLKFDEDHERVILNPALKDSVLGWSAIATDVEARFPDVLASSAIAAMADGSIQTARRNIYYSILHTFYPIHSMGWKITDVALEMSIKDSMIEFSRIDSGEGFPKGLRRTAYLTMTPVDALDQFRTEFQDQVYRISPILIRAVPQFRQINHFAAVMALVRLAKLDGARFNQPQGTPKVVITPEYVVYRRDGVHADPTPLCKAAK